MGDGVARRLEARDQHGGPRAIRLQPLGGRAHGLVGMPVRADRGTGGEAERGRTREETLGERRGEAAAVVDGGDGLGLQARGRELREGVALAVVGRAGAEEGGPPAGGECGIRGRGCNVRESSSGEQGSGGEGRPRVHGADHGDDAGVVNQLAGCARGLSGVGMVVGDADAHPGSSVVLRQRDGMGQLPGVCGLGAGEGEQGAKRWRGGHGWCASPV